MDQNLPDEIYIGEIVNICRIEFNSAYKKNNDKYKFWHGGRSSPITYIQTLPSSFNNGLLNLFGIRTAQNTPEERSNGDSIANSIFRYKCHILHMYLP